MTTYTDPGLTPEERDILRQILEGSYWSLPWGEMSRANAREAAKPTPKKTETRTLFKQPT